MHMIFIHIMAYQNHSFSLRFKSFRSMHCTDGRCPAFIDEEYTQLTEICEWEPSNFDWIQVYVLLGVTSESFSFSDGLMAFQITEELMVWMTCLS